MAAAESELPFHLRGNYAPVQEEVTAFDLPVTGAIPPELSGLYLRNGPNPQSGTSSHWFTGDGMVHGVRLERGKAAWYRNRWVRTKVLENPELRFVGEFLQRIVMPELNLDTSIESPSLRSVVRRQLLFRTLTIAGHGGRVQIQSFGNGQGDTMCPCP